MAQKITRNDYYNLIRETGKIPKDDEYEIIPLDLSAYSLKENTKKIVNAVFTVETTNRDGEYMLKGFWLCNRCYQFAKQCDFTLTQISVYSSYAYSDEQMAVFTYTEGDIYLTLFTNKEKYEKEKEATIQFYMEDY